MAPRDRKKLAPELQLLTQRLLAQQADQVRVEDLQELARAWGVHLVQVDPRAQRGEAVELGDNERVAESAEERAQRFCKESEDELLALNAARLGLKLLTAHESQSGLR
jgi:hypothetical protein